MTARSHAAGLIIAAAITALAGAAIAQDAPPLQEEILTDGAAPAPTGPQWRAFSRSSNSVFLVDIGSLTKAGDEARIKIARVPLTAAAGDYSHVVDDFAARCASSQTHLTASTDVLEDGEPTEAFPVDEPWSRVQPGSFDDAIKQFACDDMLPAGDAFPSVRAYIDAGRP